MAIVLQGTQALQKGREKKTISVWSSTKTWRTFVQVEQQGWVSACGSGSEERSVRVASQWDWATDSTEEVRKWRVLLTISLNDSRKYLDCTPCLFGFFHMRFKLLWHPQITKWHGTSNTDNFCRASRTASWCRHRMGQAVSYPAGSVIHKQGRSGCGCVHSVAGWAVVTVK